MYLLIAGTPLEHRYQHPRHIPAEIRQYRQQSAKVHCHVESEPLIVPAEQLRWEDEVR